MLPVLQWYLDRTEGSQEPVRLRCEVLRAGVESNCWSADAESCWSVFGKREWSSYEESLCPGPWPGDVGDGAAFASAARSGARRLAACSCYYLPWALVRPPGGSDCCAFLDGRGGGELSREEAQTFSEKLGGASAADCWLWEGALALRGDPEPRFPGPGGVTAFLLGAGMAACACCAVAALAEHAWSSCCPDFAARDPCHEVAFEDSEQGELLAGSSGDG